MPEHPLVNIKFLRTFLTLVEERSTKQAGHRLNMSKSNVLLHISGLEKVVGVQLLERRFPPYREEMGRTQLTEAGRAFLPKAMEAVRAHDRLFDDASLKSDPREQNWAIATQFIEMALAALRHDLSEKDRMWLYDTLAGPSNRSADLSAQD